MTDSAKKQAESALAEVIDSRVAEIKLLIQNMNPRLSILIKFFLERWAMKYASSSIAEIYSQARHSEWLDVVGSWDIQQTSSIQGTSSLLPQQTRQEIADFILQMKKVGVAANADQGHNTYGWSGGSVLVTSPSMGAAIVKEFWGSELPWPISAIIDELYKSQIEAEFGFTLTMEGRLFIERDLHKFLGLVGYRQLYNYLYLIHSTEFGGYRREPVDWEQIIKYVRPPYFIERDKDDRYRERLPVSSQIGRLYSRAYTQLSEYRNELVIKKTRKALAEWLEKGTIQIKPDMPSWRQLWDVYEEGVDKELQSYIDRAASKL